MMGDHMHRMRRVHMMVLGRRGRLWLKLCDVRCDHFAFPFLQEAFASPRSLNYDMNGNEGKYTHMLQLCKHFFTNAVLVELGLNGGNDFVYDRAVDLRLKNVSVTGLNYYS